MSRKRKNALELLPVPHGFRYYVQTLSGSPIERIVKAKVYRGITEVEIEMTVEHVRRSLLLNGSGNAGLCAGAVCLASSQASFGHLVTGHAEWIYTRVYIVSKVDREGNPLECVVYQHNDGAAEMFDTVEGQMKLLRDLAEHGPKKIKLTPVPSRPVGSQAGAPRPGPSARSTVARTEGRQLGLRGVNLRRAQVSLQWNPSAVAA